MNLNAGPRLRLLLGGTAALGVILAHCAAFVIVQPDRHLRHELLTETGHTYGTGLALALFVAGLASLVWNSIHASRMRSMGEVFRAAAPKLTLLQVIGFVLLEAAERMFRHGSLLLGELLTEPVLAIGVMAQVVVAILGAALVALLSRAVAAIAAAIRSSATRPARILIPTSTSDAEWSQVHLAVGGLTLRGPPASR
ncbi:MAG: hypothetical protein M3N24_06160 [Actinomycetota bacterium]|nr:hypothetical protein [Actinomycetota bacterium]